MKLPRILSTLALIIIAINLTVINVRSARSEATKQHKPEMKQTVVEVVGQVSTPYDNIGGGSTGFLVRNGGKLEFVEFDLGSRFYHMATPKNVMITEFASGWKTYTPLIDK